MTSSYNPKKLFREPGVIERVSFETTAEAAVTDSRVDSSYPVVASLDLVASDRGVDVTGTVSARYVALCRRCLNDVDGELSVEVDERFSLTPDSEDDAFEIDEEGMDLAQMARELVVLALPLSPLCREDCEGPSPEKFPVAVETDESEASAPVDPRWAALDVLKESFDD